MKNLLLAFAVLTQSAGPAAAQAPLQPSTPSAAKVKTKIKSLEATVKTKTGTPPEAAAGGAPLRVETLSGIDVYPKPSTNRILLSFTQQFTQPGALTMTDAARRVVYQQPLDPRRSTGAPVDLGHLPAGTYLVEARTGNYVYWRKVRIKYPAASRI